MDGESTSESPWTEYPEYLALIAQQSFWTRNSDASWIRRTSCKTLFSRPIGCFTNVEEGQRPSPEPGAQDPFEHDHGPLSHVHRIDTEYQPGAVL